MWRRGERRQEVEVGIESSPGFHAHIAVGYSPRALSAASDDQEFFAVHLAVEDSRNDHVVGYNIPADACSDGGGGGDEYSKKEASSFDADVTSFVRG